jgi:predicted phosphoribosyltransferase
MGALAAGGVGVLNGSVIEQLHISPSAVDELIQREERELERRERLYRGARPPAAIQGRTVILVDDGLATGSTMRAAVDALRSRKPARLVVAVPIAAPSTHLRRVPRGGRRDRVRGHPRALLRRRAVVSGLFADHRRRSARAA